MKINISILVSDLGVQELHREHFHLTREGLLSAELPLRTESDVVGADALHRRLEARHGAAELLDLDLVSGYALVCPAAASR